MKEGSDHDFHFSPEEILSLAQSNFIILAIISSNVSSVCLELRSILYLSLFYLGKLTILFWTSQATILSNWMIHFYSYLQTKITQWAFSQITHWTCNIWQPRIITSFNLGSVKVSCFYHWVKHCPQYWEFTLSYEQIVMFGQQNKPNKH